MHNPVLLRNRATHRGFSLLELAVVVAILSILLSIGVAVFLGQRKGAQDRGAQSSLRNAATVARAVATNSDDSYPGPDTEDLIARLEADEPSLQFVDGPSTAPYEVSVTRLDDNHVILAAWSQSGVCFAVNNSLDGPNTYGEAADTDPNTPGQQCDSSTIIPDFLQGKSFGDNHDLNTVQVAGCEAVTDISVEECNALVAFYYALGGDNWTNNDGWLTDYENFCDNPWFGVSCYGAPDDKYVGAIYLNGNNLNGHLPPAIGALTRLEELALNNNEGIGGTFPAEFGQLENLVALYLDGVSMGGQLPATMQTLWGLEAYKEFYIYTTGCLTAPDKDVKDFMDAVANEGAGDWAGTGC